MWKRLNNPKGTRQSASSESSPTEPQFNEKDMAWSNDFRVMRKQLPQDRNKPPPRPPRGDSLSKGLPRLPFEPGSDQNLPPLTRQSREDPTLRPASSVYSQPSPALVTTTFPRNPYHESTEYTESEISPPSSPEFGASHVRSQAHANADDENVSPMDQMPDISRLGFREPPDHMEGNIKGSSIPVMRREKKRMAAAGTNMDRKDATPKGRQAVDPRWDPYSGEITTSEKGKPQSVKPGQFGALGLRSVHKATGIVLGNETSIGTAPKPQHTSFGDRIRKLKGSAPAEKPEWQGATRTGRSAVVSPGADQPSLAPLEIPRKSSKRLASPVNSGANTPVTVRSDDGETKAVSMPMQYDSDPTIGSVLANDGESSQSVMQEHSHINVTPDSHVVSQSAATKSLARGEYVEDDFQITPEKTKETHQSPPGTIERNFREHLQQSFPAPSDPYVQPPSRFSITTYAPSEAQSTPRPSIDTFDQQQQQQQPAMPTPPIMQPSRMLPTPVINRKRPTNESPSKRVSRKAVAAPKSPVFISMSTTSPHPRMGMSLTKALPPPPADRNIASNDLVTSLTAQLESLAARRFNISRSIRQMTELMPKDNLLVTEDVRIKREMEKMKVERLRMEEADIKREEHQVGLRLHRAWKRRDKEAVFEPTGLWVRRVTG